MKPAASFWLGLAGAALMLALSAGVLQARDTRFPEPPLAERLLYLQSGAVADRTMLQFDAIAADVYWIRTIQHYGRDRRSSRPDRFSLLEPLLELTTTLDPHFTIAYRFGAIFLALEPPNGAGRADRAVRLLEKGLRRDPGPWQYAHDIGFVHYWFARDFVEAARWFERAAGMQGAPEWLLPLSAVTRIEGGDRTGARLLLRSLVEAPEPYIRNAAERGLQQLQALDAIDELQARVAEYRNRTGDSPSAWGDLFPGQAGQVPLDPTGEPYVYDASAHAVTLSPRSALNPLPAMPGTR